MSPYRNPRVLVALAGLACAGLVLIVIVNETSEGALRLVATLAIALVIWLGLMGILRVARRR